MIGASLVVIAWPWDSDGGEKMGRCGPVWPPVAFGAEIGSGLVLQQFSDMQLRGPAAIGRMRPLEARLGLLRHRRRRTDRSAERQDQAEIAEGRDPG